MNVQVFQSEDSAVSNKNLRFHLIKSFEDGISEDAAAPNCCVEVSNRYGATFILHNGNLRLLESKNLLVGQTLPSPIKNGISYIALSCDETLLAVAQGSTVSIFETKVFCQQPNGGAPRSSFIVSKAGAPTTQLAWNPADPKLISALGQDGTIILIRILDTWAIEAVSAVDTTFRCMSWSPKGKQLAVGGTSGIVQLKLDLKEAKRIPLPGPGQECISIYWLSTLQFLVSFQPQGHDDIKIMLLTLSKTAATIYKDFGDIFLSDDFTDARVISKVIHQWKIHLLFSSTSSEVIVISNDPSLPISDLIVQEIEDRFRAALPLDNFCRGAGLFVGCSDSVVINGEDLRGSPILILLSQKGLVTLFKVINEGAESIYVPVTEPVPIQTSIQAPASAASAPAPAVTGVNSNLSSQPVSLASAATPAVAPSSMFGSFQLPVATSTSAVPSSGQSFFGNLNLNLGGSGAKPLFGMGTESAGTGSFLGTPIASVTATTTPASSSFFAQPKPAVATAVAPTATSTNLFGGQSSIGAPVSSSSAPTFNFGAFSSPGTGAGAGIGISQASSATAGTATTTTTAGLGQGFLAGQQQAKPFDFKSFSLGDADKGKSLPIQPQGQLSGGSGVGGGSGDGLAINLAAATVPTASSQAQLQQPRTVHPQNQAQAQAQLGTGKGAVSKLPGSLPTDQQIQEMRSHLQKYDYKNLLEQLTAFERRYANFKQIQAQKAKANQAAIRSYFSQLDTQILRDLHQVTDFSRDIIETTNGQREEIEGLSIMLQNLFTKLEFGLIAAEKSTDPKYLRLLRSQPVDPASLEKLSKVEKQFSYVSNQLKECRRYFYHKDQNLRPLDRAVSTGFLQQTLENHAMIILNMKKQVVQLRRVLNEQQIGRTQSISKNHITLDDIESGVSLLKLKPTPEERKQEQQQQHQQRNEKYKPGSGGKSTTINIENGQVVPKAIIYSSDKIQHLKRWAGQTLITRVPVSGAIDPYLQLSAVRKIRLNPEASFNEPPQPPSSAPVHVSAFASSPTATATTLSSFFGASMTASVAPSGANAFSSMSPLGTKKINTSSIPTPTSSLLKTGFQTSSSQSAGIPTATVVPASSSSILFSSLSSPITSKPVEIKPATSSPSFFSSPQQPVKIGPTSNAPTTPAPFSFASPLAAAKKEETVASTPSPGSFFAPLSTSSPTAAGIATSKPSFFSASVAASVAKVAPSVQEVSPVQSVPASTPAFSFLGSNKGGESPTTAVSTSTTTAPTTSAPSLFGSPVFSFGTPAAAGAKPGTTSSPSFFGGVGGGSMFGSSIGAAAGKPPGGPLFGFSSGSSPPVSSTTTTTTKPALLPTPSMPPMFQQGSGGSTTATDGSQAKAPSLSGTPAKSASVAGAGGFSTLTGLLTQPSKGSPSPAMFGGSTSTSITPISPPSTPEPQPPSNQKVESSTSKPRTEAEPPTAQPAPAPLKSEPSEPALPASNVTAAPGSQSQTATASSGLFGLGTENSSGASSLFGSLSITPVASSGGGTFGTNGAAPASSIFGGSSLFGGKPSTGIGAGGASSIFGSGSTAQTSAAPVSATITTAFGSPLSATATTPSSTSIQSATTPVVTSTSLFGTPTSTTTTAASPSLLGTPATAKSTESSTPSLFGSAPLFQTPAGSVPQGQSPSLFATPGAASTLGAGASPASVFGTPGGSTGSGGSSAPSMFATPLASTPSIFGSPPPNTVVGQNQGQTPVSPSIFGGDGGSVAASSPLTKTGPTGAVQQSLFGSSPFGAPATNAFGSPAGQPAQQQQQQQPGQSLFGSPSFGDASGGGGGLLKPPTGLFSSIQPTGGVFGQGSTAPATTSPSAFGTVGAPGSAAPAFGGGAVFGGSPAFGSAIKPSAFGSSSIFGGGSAVPSTSSFGDLAGGGGGGIAGTQAASSFGVASQGFGTAQQQVVPQQQQQQQSPFGAFGGGVGSSAFGGGQQAQPAFGSAAGGAFGSSSSFGQSPAQAASPAFGGSPSFGGGAVFGGSPAFGSGANPTAFGGAGGGSIFGGGSAAAPVAAPTFGGLASSTGGQQSASIFGGGQPSAQGFSSFGGGGGSFGGGGAVQQAPAQSAFGGASFSSFGQQQPQQQQQLQQQLQQQPQQQQQSASFGGQSFSSWR